MADETREQTAQVRALVTDGEPTTITRVVPGHLGIELFDVVQVNTSLSPLNHTHPQGKAGISEVTSAEVAKGRLTTTLMGLRNRHCPGPHRQAPHT
jgi:hypothetical protein